MALFTYKAIDTRGQTMLGQIAAVNIRRTQTVLGAFYRRLAARVGKAQAVTATARKLAVNGVFAKQSR